MDTATGKDTLHDTVGIIYQDMNEADDLVSDNIPEDSNEPINKNEPSGSKRRRTTKSRTTKSRGCQS